MTGNGGDEAPWSDLADDLLGTIYRRFSSGYDRVRFAAVCTSWSAVALRNPKLPAIPLLVPSTCNSRRDREARAYSPEDGRVLGAPLPWFPWGEQLLGCHDGGWIAAGTGSQIAIVNLFTGVRLQLCPRQREFSCTCPTALEVTKRICFMKVIFSDDPDSEDCILAAITTKCVIALCRVCSPEAGWTTRGCGIDTLEKLEDIVFSKGKLYGISYGGELYKLDISLKKDGSPLVTSFDLVTTEKPILSDHMVVAHDRHIFELHGKLATVVAVKRIGSYRHGSNFRVFELTDSNKPQPSKYTWVEVKSLGDQALFLSRGCCKLAHVSDGAIRGEVEANHIYYSRRLYSSIHRGDPEFLSRFDLGSFVVHCCESKGGPHLERIMPRGYLYSDINYDAKDANGCNSCMWVFPPQF